MEEGKLKLLQSQREYVYRDIQILYDLSIAMIQDHSKVSSFKARYSRIHSIREEFVSLCSKIQALELAIKPEAQVSQKSLSSFDDLYYAVISAAADLPTTEKSGNVDGTSSHTSSVLERAEVKSNSGRNARLPKLELPKFDSKIENWQTFYDIYKSLIHDNKSISEIEKFHYLASCLQGPALSIVKGVPMTADNYEVVFNSLIERYQNKRLIALSYLDKFFNLPAVKSGNFQDLQKLTGEAYEAYHALQSMKIENLGDFVLFYLTSRSLDPDTRIRFETQTNISQIPTFCELLKFLQDYVKILETNQLSSKSTNNNNSSTPRKLACTKFPIAPAPRGQNSSGQKRSSYLAKSNSLANVACAHCNNAHSIYQCPTFQSLDSRARLALIKTKNNMCTNCLRTNHVIEKCLSKMTCTVCGLRHHTLLHIDQAPSTSAGASTEANVTAHSHAAVPNRDMVLLGTCQVRALNTAAGTQCTVRALVDSGAQDCFITSACAKTLGLKLRRCNLTIAGLGQNSVTHVKGVTDCTILPVHGDAPHFNIKPVVLDNITALIPSVKVPSVVRERSKHLVLADRDYDVPAKIDLLIGAELFHDIYDGQRINLGPGLPTALHSVFGWILTGAVNSNSVPLNTACSLVATTFKLEEQIQKFWEVEEPPRTIITVPENDTCERMYTDLTYREPNGRYVVPILLKEGDRSLGESYNNTLSRFTNLEKKLNRQTELKSDYVNFMREYENLNHMYPAPDPAVPTLNRYLIPHSCVVRPESTTTKLRVVFDASSKTTNGLSLNDIVYTGPKLQVDIVDIITGFRLHTVVVTCDISKMYRGILIRPEDRNYQHILWRESPSDPVKEYELATVTYGVSSSPYLAIRTLNQLAVDHGAAYPRAAEALLHETYVDDITSGAPSVREAIELKNQLISLLGCAQLELRKWSSNSQSVLNTLPVDHCQKPKLFSDESDKSTLKILGVQYDPVSDNFSYSHSPIEDGECTKRSILSSIARIFDPLGWLTPCILKAKLLLQDLWRLNLSWDEPVPRDVAVEWQTFIADLHNLNLIQIPRRIIPSQSKAFQLIGFCDGSTKAYGCCVYLRVATPHGVQVYLLIAKSKVAPLKVLTVNRLELCSAVLLVKVINRIHSLLSSKIILNKSTLFTDSSTVLSWLNTEPHKLKTFVAHRVVLINDSPVPTEWRHVSTHDNPADVCSRGLSCLSLSSAQIWWSGPQWLHHEPFNWPVSAVEVSDNVPELKPSSRACHTTVTREADLLDSIMERHSSLSHVERVVAWINRFIKNAKAKRSDRNLLPYLTAAELSQSLDHLTKYVQQQSFNDVISLIASNRPLPKHLSKLSPFVDTRGILRVGGRLKHASLPCHVKHPYLLPKTSRLSTLLIDHFHATYLHCGPRLLQSLVMRRYWILGVRNLIRSRLSKCVICFKIKPIPLQPFQGDLPPSRLQTGHCFQTIGIDFGGPFIIKESRRRNAKTYKAYLCLIVCHATKAVHLELVTELTSEAFIAALDRFVSRRGLCHSIVTDGGTNFVGARRYLSEVSEMLNRERNSISNQLASRGITWKLNPPSGPHFGGIFESGIKSTKYHLKRIIGSQVLTFEELYTILTKIEAMLNSRPLVELSSDPDEVDALTAGHFLIGRPLISLPEPVHSENETLRTRWQLLQRLSQIFWRTWQRDYLHTLQQRLKWFKHGNHQPKLNDLVTIYEPNLPANEWRLGRVVQLHPGKDNITRVVTVKTSKGLLTRPAVKICPLPIEQNN